MKPLRKRQGRKRPLSRRKQLSRRSRRQWRRKWKGKWKRQQKKRLRWKLRKTPLTTSISRKPMTSKIC